MSFFAVYWLPNFTEQATSPLYEIHYLVFRAAQAAAKHRVRALRPVVGGRHVGSEPIESDMVTELFASLNAALGPWLPLLLVLLGVGGPLCIYLQGRSAERVAEITGRYGKETAVEVARINADAQVAAARMAATGAPEVPRKRRITVRGAVAQAPGRDY